MRIGYVLPNSWGLPDPHDDIELAVRAEEVGISSVWVSHHVLHVGFVKDRLGAGNYYDSLISLTAAALATSRVRVGTSVLVLGYLNPFVLAKQLATIDWLSRGRLDVGVGVGALRAEFDAVHQAPFNRRGDYADECIDVLRRLWDGGPQNYRGEFFTLDGVESAPGSYRPEGIPVFVGGSTPAAITRLVERGDGWHGIGLDADGVREQRERLSGALASAGRDIDDIPYQLRLHVDADDVDVASWRERAHDYADAGVTDLIIAPQSRAKHEHLHWLDTVLSELTALD